MRHLVHNRLVRPLDVLPFGRATNRARQAKYAVVLVVHERCAQSGEECLLLRWLLMFLHIEKFESVSDERCLREAEALMSSK